MQVKENSEQAWNLLLTIILKLKRLYRLKDKDLKISCGTTKCWTGFYSSAYQSHKSVQKSKSTHDHDTVRNLPRNKLLRKMEEADFTVQTIPIFLSLSFHILNEKKIVLEKFQIRYNNWAFFH